MSLIGKSMVFNMLWTVRQKLGAGLLVGTALSAWFTWKVVERAVLVEAASSFLIPGLWLALLLILVLLGSLVWREREFAALGAFFITIPSLLVVISLVHCLMLILATGIVYLGIRHIQTDITERVRLSVRKSLLVGMPAIFLGVSILLSSQYYIHVQLLPWDRLVPSFNLAEGIGPTVLQLLSPVYPEIRRLREQQVTVDDFLEDVQKREHPPTSDTLPALTQKALINQELTRAKQQLGSLLGHEVSGTENMQALLAEVIHRKTIAFFSGEQTHLPVPILPFFLSLLLFLTVYPIMNFLAPLLGAVTLCLFRIAQLLHWVEIRTRAVNQEIVAD